MEDDYVLVANDETVMEFPLESDGTLTLSTVQSHFPNAIGLKYKAASGAWRGLRAVDNIFDPPKSGWSDTTYYSTESQSQKRTKSDHKNTEIKITKSLPVVNPLLQDMAVLGLPWSTTDDELKQYFSEYCGDVTYAEVKVDRQTGKSRGFGFIRFKSEECAQTALQRDHYIGGRKLEVKLKKETPMKLFVGRLPPGTTKTELDEYFSQFGEVSDSYVPTPFRGFGFVTYTSSDVGGSVLNSEHVINGVRLNLSKGEESKSFNSKKRGKSQENNSFNSSQDDLLDNALRKFVIEQVDPTAELKSKLYAYLQGQT